MNRRELLGWAARLPLIGGLFVPLLVPVEDTTTAAQRLRHSGMIHGLQCWWTAEQGQVYPPPEPLFTEADAAAERRFNRRRQGPESYYTEDGSWPVPALLRLYVGRLEGLSKVRLVAGPRGTQVWIPRELRGTDLVRWYPDNHYGRDTLKHGFSYTQRFPIGAGYLVRCNWLEGGQTLWLPAAEGARADIIWYEWQSDFTNAHQSAILHHFGARSEDGSFDRTWERRDDLDGAGAWQANREEHP